MLLSATIAEDLTCALLSAGEGEEVDELMGVEAIAQAWGQGLQHRELVVVPGEELQHTGSLIRGEVIAARGVLNEADLIVLEGLALDIADEFGEGLLRTLRLLPSIVAPRRNRN